jgi:hypothetical protein
MSALTPAEAAKALRELADRVEAGEAGLALSPHWPLVFRAGDAHDPAGLAAAGRSLGVEDPAVEWALEEDGTEWLRLRGHAGGVAVEVTADVSARVPDALRSAA